MLWFNGKKQQTFQIAAAFQYIICYGLTNIAAGTTGGKICFNTSYVMV